MRSIAASFLLGGYQFHVELTTIGGNMTHDEYDKKITQINLRLEKISQQILGLAKHHVANMDNPVFVDLMNQFDANIDSAEKHTTKMLELLGLS
jgi:hypothetical protein